MQYTGNTHYKPTVLSVRNDSPIFMAQFFALIETGLLYTHVACQSAPA